MFELNANELTDQNTCITQITKTSLTAQLLNCSYTATERKGVSSTPRPQFAGTFTGTSVSNACRITPIPSTTSTSFILSAILNYFRVRARAFTCAKLLNGCPVFLIVSHRKGLSDFYNFIKTVTINFATWNKIKEM